ncbi:hypothetical protein TSUD_23400 [Trifolium subterraneum]|uniref:RNase H type-1 domain-containing protein n=1 Tax=Trifolium subterraneum TaxID=3900 RepID=A0A2Z6M2B6_TRISU|nr:hypothetical protein TSUD_23400 [Trifolium subterraneum]
MKQPPSPIDTLSSVMVSAACQQGNAADKVFALCRNENYATIGRVAMLFWSIWHNQNDKIWNDNVRNPSQVGRAAFDHWKRSEKPRVEWLKCNIDATFFVDLRRTTMGACFRNSSSEFTAGFTRWQHIVLLQAMNEAKLRGFERVQFESDSQVLVEAIRTKKRDNSEFLSIINDIILVMLSCPNFEVKFIRRQVNSVAHTLVRVANSWTSFHRF